MASLTEGHDATLSSTSPGGPRRGRDRGRGGSRQQGDRERQNNGSTGHRGRGRAGNQRGRRGNGRGGVTYRGGHLQDGVSTDQAVGHAGKGKAVLQAAADPATHNDEADGEVCFICASSVQHTAVAPCNHRTCHICSLRLRALYKTKTCAHCRTHADHVVFTDNATKNYEDFSSGMFEKTDDNLGIHFENTEIFEDTILLLRYNCPDSDCDVACLGWPDLHRHVKTVHHKSMCDLCTRNKKVFTHEHELFTFNDLKKHQKFGDDNPGDIDQSGFKGHPECGFCRQRFYGDDELYAHCREKHERCHICDRRSEGRQQQYYMDYNALEVHFRKDHFLCPDRECLEKKFVVFDSEMDLKAHQLEEHPHGLSKDARRDARRVDMSGFQLRSSGEEDMGGRREGRGRGRGRGRDPNADPLPPSSAQPLRRDELAYQRQMAIQSAQSVTGRTFGGQLTSTETYAARPPPSVLEPSTVTASRPPTTNTNQVADNLGSIDLNTDVAQLNSVPRTPQEQARFLRHNAVTERAANMLRNDAPKMEEFRTKISAFRNSKMTAAELIEAFFSLFDTTSVELGKLIKELADIFEIQAKQDDLLRAWSDWKAINEDYPSLPGAVGSSSLAARPTGHGGSRVLKLKSSTAQSSRSAVSRQASWASSSSNLFPPLALASTSRIGAKPGQTPWAGSSAAPRISPLPSRTSSSTALSKKNQNGNLAEAFPALPAASKPTSTIFSPGYSGSGLRRDNNGTRGTPANVWAAGGAFPMNNPEPAPEETGTGGAKKKGNKNKKQTLFHFG